MAKIIPSDRLQVLAAGQGWFTPYRPKALNGKVFWTAPHLEKISRNYQVGTEEKKQRHGQVGHGRRLNSCFCRKAFKEIGRDWGRHTNTTDDDDDNAVVAVEAPTPAKKKEALPAFALDFGNGA